MDRVAGDWPIDDGAPVTGGVPTIGHVLMASDALVIYRRCRLAGDGRADSERWADIAGDVHCWRCADVQRCTDGWR